MEARVRPHRPGGKGGSDNDRERSAALSGTQPGGCGVGIRARARGAQEARTSLARAFQLARAPRLRHLDHDDGHVVGLVAAVAEAVDVVEDRLRDLARAAAALAQDELLQALVAVEAMT